MNKERFVTLDVFRGMTMFLMIIVNTQGSGAVPYPMLEHSVWHGCTLTDMVFPSFLFAVGNAIPFALKRSGSLPGKIILYRIFRRSFLIFLTGYLLGWYVTMHWNNAHLVFEPFGETRIMGVLQRIALCYCIAALLAYYGSVRSVIIFSLLFLFGYWMLLAALGIPGEQYTITGNAVRSIDLQVIGAQHMYRENGIIFDPEGLLSTLPAIVNVLAGYLAGIFIIKKGKTYECMAKLGMAGMLLIVTGLSWSYFLPLNKKIWTSSYVLFTTGIDLAAISLLFYAIEIKQWKRAASFFSSMGKNPLFIYVLSNLFLFFFILPVTPDMIFIDWINTVFFQKIAPGPFGALLFAISFTMICWCIAWVMDKRKVYIRL